MKYNSTLARENLQGELSVRDTNRPLRKPAVAVCFPKICSYDEVKLMPSIIRIWKYCDAPQHLKELHPHAAELTWVMEAPSQMSGDAESMIRQRLHLFTDVSCYELPDGTKVIFGRSSNRATGDSSDAKTLAGQNERFPNAQQALRIGNRL